MCTAVSYFLLCVIVTYVVVGPGDGDSKYWKAIFARRQPDMPNNPKKAKYGANWKKIVRKYPDIRKNAPKVIKALEQAGLKMTKKFSFRLPYVRVCIPVRVDAFIT